MKNKTKLLLLPHIESLVKEGASIADAFLTCNEKGVNPGPEQFYKIFKMIYRVELILSTDVNLDKYPSFKRDYMKWKKAVTKK